MLECYERHKKLCIYGGGVLSEELRKNYFDSISPNAVSKAVKKTRVKGRKKRKCRGKIIYQKHSSVNNIPPNISENKARSNSGSQILTNPIESSIQDSRRLDVFEEYDLCENEEEYAYQLKLAIEMSLKENNFMNHLIN